MSAMSSPLFKDISPSIDPSFCRSAQPEPLAGSISSLPSGELDGIALAGTVDGAGEAAQGELSAGLAEDDIGGSAHIVIRRLDDSPPAAEAHAGAARSL